MTVFIILKIVRKAAIFFSNIKNKEKGITERRKICVSKGFDYHPFL